MRRLWVQTPLGVIFDEIYFIPCNFRSDWNASDFLIVKNAINHTTIKIWSNIKAKIVMPLEGTSIRLWSKQLLLLNAYKIIQCNLPVLKTISKFWCLNMQNTHPSYVALIYLFSQTNIYLIHLCWLCLYCYTADVHVSIHELTIE